MEPLDAIRARLRDVPDPVALLEGLFAFAPVAFQIFRADGRSMLVNPAFRELFGSEPPPDYNVLQDDIAERNGVLETIRRAFAGETVRTPPIWYDPRELRKVQVEEGNRVAISATIFPLFDAARAVSHVAIAFRDMTAELLAQQKIEAERDLLRTVIDQSGDGVVVADSAGVIRIFNEEAQRQHGVGHRPVASDAWVSTYGLERVDGSPISADELPLFRALEGHRSVGRWRVRRPDGTIRDLTGIATPLRSAAGESAGAVLTTRDETERLEREAERDRTERYRDQMLGMLGHDLRNPLNAVLWSANFVLRSEALPDALRPAVARIANSAERMGRMISDLLDFTRVRLGEALPLGRRTIDLQEIVRTVVDEIAVANPDRRIEVEADGITRGDWDPDRLAQIVSNLVGNAVEHGRGTDPVRVRTEGDEARVRLSVWNGGAPIPEEERSGIFEPFRKGVRSGRSGLGLGLFIVSAIARAHGGNVEVRSDAESGTTFEVVLPRGGEPTDGGEVRTPRP